MLSVIIPAYNAADSIISTIDSSARTLEADNIDYELIVVDDGSTDGTYELVLDQNGNFPQVRCVHYDQNKGKGYALSYGFQFSSGDLVMFLDADSDLPPQQIPRVLNRLIETDADGIIGSKSHPEAKSNGYPATRKFLSKGYNLLVRALFNLSFTNTQTGLKVFRREVLSKIIPKIMVTGFAFDLEVLVRALGSGYRIMETPVTMTYLSESRVNPKVIWNLFRETMQIFWRCRLKNLITRNSTQS
jgi:dolichol-phosphate mannosyltransferase